MQDFLERKYTTIVYNILFSWVNNQREIRIDKEVNFTLALGARLWPGKQFVENLRK